MAVYIPYIKNSRAFSICSKIRVKTRSFGFQGWNELFNITPNLTAIFMYDWLCFHQIYPVCFLCSLKKLENYKIQAKIYVPLQPTLCD